MSLRAAIVIAGLGTIVAGCDRAEPPADVQPAQADVQSVENEKETTPESGGVIENEFGMRFVSVPFETKSGEQPKPIYMLETEVTVDQYRRVRVASGQPIDAYEREPADSPLQPKDFDYWIDAFEFAELVTAIDTKYAYRLPSEAEWEFACRSGQKDKPKAAKRCHSDEGFWLLKQHAPNGYGLYDMLGVLGEYCSDCYYSKEERERQRGLYEGNDARVARGMRQSTQPVGYFLFEMDYRFRVTRVGGSEPKMIIGVRLVLEPKDARSFRTECGVPSESPPSKSHPSAFQIEYEPFGTEPILTPVFDHRPVTA